jgi:hypothetical protein
MKLLGLLLFMIIGLVISIRRFLRNSTSKKRGSQLVDLVENNPEMAEELALELQNVYVTFPNDNRPLRQVLEPIVEKSQLGKFIILKKIELKSKDFLIISLCYHENFDMGMNGQLANKNDVTQYNFTVRDKGETNVIEVCSEYFFDLNDKFLRKEFGDNLVKAVSKS